MLDAAIQGFVLSGSLIVAIGAQNAFVLRQGLQREHVLPVVAFCAASDALLIAFGVAGMGVLLAQFPSLDRWLAVAGALFLGGYGTLALVRAVRGNQSLEVGPTSATSARRVLAQAAAFTFLNPHVYLDTLWLVGTVGAQQSAPDRPAFVGGGAAASVIWFCALGWAGRWLSPWFARPAAWRVLDAVIGATMLALAAALAGHALLGGQGSQ